MGKAGDLVVQPDLGLGRGMRIFLTDDPNSSLIEP